MTQAANGSAHANPTPPPAIYVAIVQAIEKRHIQLALTLVDLDELVQWV